MIDAHVHLEKGDYSVEWIEQFVAYAIKRNIDEIYFLEHSVIGNSSGTRMIMIWILRKAAGWRLIMVING